MSTGVYDRGKTAFDRFVEKIDASDPLGCWTWTAYRAPTGYGQFSLNGRPTLSHRFACEVAHGPIPKGLVVDHLCRNPPCVNPAHLEVVTMGENTRRGTAYQAISARAAKRKACIRGHAFAGENLAFDRNGARVCRACRSLLSSQWSKSNRAHKNAMQRIRRARSGQ